MDMDDAPAKKPKLPYFKTFTYLVIITVLSVLLFLLAGYLDLSEALFSFLKGFEALEADEFLIVIIFLAIALGVVAVLLWRELKTVIAGYSSMESSYDRVNARLSFLNGFIRQDMLNELTALHKELEQAGQRPDLSRIRAGINRIQRQVKFTKEYQDIGAAAPAWQNVADTIMRAKVGVNLGRVTFEMKVGNVEIYADPLLEKVFFYMIDNALKHGGEKLTKISFRQKTAEDKFIIVCEDDGGGISADKKGFLFPKEFGRGYGYGLFMIREILAVTNISIREAGISGIGAKFEITVPAKGYRQL
jgi:signal transduction histidine kinase